MWNSYAEIWYICCHVSLSKSLISLQKLSYYDYEDQNFPSVQEKTRYIGNNIETDKESYICLCNTPMNHRTRCPGLGCTIGASSLLVHLHASLWKVISYQSPLRLSVTLPHPPWCLILPESSTEATRRSHLIPSMNYLTVLTSVGPSKAVFF